MLKQQSQPVSDIDSIVNAIDKQKVRKLNGVIFPRLEPKHEIQEIKSWVLEECFEDL